MPPNLEQKQKAQNQKPKKQGHLSAVGLGFFVLCFLFFMFGAPRLFSRTYERGGTATTTNILEALLPPKKDTVPHIKTPDVVKAIYMTQCVVGTPSFRDELVALIDETELNAVVIDIKDYTGKVAFPTGNPAVAPSVSDACGAHDMKDFVQRLHDKDIYIIGRITVFQDPFYSSVHPELAVKKASDGTVWKDHKGLSFIDVGARDFWKYIVEVSKESFEIGFDELNYDYVRYPSDGNMKDIAFTLSEGKPKADVLESFFAYLYDELSEPWDEVDDVPALSVDLFGYTTTNTDDLGIGQVIERALPYFNFVMPMVYPSHYNAGFIGIAKPATDPYAVVKYSMDAAVRRANILAAAKDSTSTSTDMIALREQAEKGHGNINALQLRPWLQDFNLGATYTADMVRAQITATYDAGLNSWALWDAGNTYTEAALHPDELGTVPALP
ncbi:MAG: putative glycoside hydrolase [Patescibacteria group bacterium]